MVLAQLTLCWDVFAARRRTPVVEVIQENAAAVVNISTEQIVLLQENPYWRGYGDEFDLLFGQFFSGYSSMHALKLKSVGSGVILDKQGIIITNAHVVNMASNVFVILSDGASVEGQVVYEDLKQDLALVKIIPSHSLKEIKLGKPQDIIVGETAIAIGNPLGLENSVTVGVVSGKNRELYLPGSDVICKELIQTDTPINPGNSGGALLNLDGELMGINVAVVQDSQSIGFAIPVERITEILGNYLNQGSNINEEVTVDPMKASSALSAGEDIDFFNDIFNHSFEDYFKLNDPKNFYNSVSGIQENEAEYILNVDINGLDKDTLNIEIKQQMVIISAENSSSREESSQNSFSQSQSYGFYSNIIPLPAAADTQKAKTNISQNTLEIIFPKK